MFEADPIPCADPISPLRATVYGTGSRLVCTGGYAIEPNIKLPWTSFADYLKTLHHLNWCLADVEIVQDGRELATAIQTGATASVIAISDGSFKNTYGTAAWTIGTVEQDGLLAGKVVCPGGEADQSSYRSELMGLYAMLVAIHHLCIFYDIKEGQVEIGCDGSSALTTVFEWGPYLAHDTTDFDLVGAIHAIRKVSCITWSYRHVRGHQDDYSSELDVWAQRNVNMDSKAKAHLAVAQHTERHYDIEGEPWQVWIKHNKVTANIQMKLYACVQEIDSIKYWEAKQEQPDSLQVVDWVSIGRAMAKIPRTRRGFITKHVAGMCGMGKFMKRWREWDTENCPRCGLPEDAPHVWTCKGDGTGDIWIKAIQELKKLLRTLDTDPTLLHILITYLKGWYSGANIRYEPPREFQRLLQE